MNLLKSILNNKIVSLIIVITIAIFLLGIIGKQLIERKYSNWPNTIENRNSEIKSSINQFIKYRQDKFLLTKNEIVDKLTELDNNSFNNISSVANSSINENFLIAILKDNEIFYWNNNYREISELKDTSYYNFGELFFVESGLNNYLACREKLIINDKEVIILLGEIIEKKYKLNDSFYNDISLTKLIKNKISTDIKLIYSNSAKENKDGRKYSFELKNNFGNKIGQATFVVQSREKSIMNIEETISILQGLLILFGYFVLGYWFFRTILKYNNIIKLGLISIYFISFRYLIVLLEFPRRLFTSELLNDKIYFSNYGYGIAHSPLDLFITQILALIILLFVFRFSLKKYKTETHIRNHSILRFIIILLVGVILYVLFLRGLGAALRSFVFDSSIRYFQNRTLSFSSTDFLMHINILLLGLVSTLTSVSILVGVIYSYKKYISLKIDKGITILFLFLLIILIMFTFIQTHPQMTILLKFIQVGLIFIFLHLILKNKLSSLSKIVILFIISSSISIGALLFYNSELERASLKTTADIISKADDDWYKDLIIETLVNDFSLSEGIEAFSNTNTNFNTAAFKIWSKSKLQQESINSSVNFINLSGNLLGGFGSIYPKANLDKFIDTNDVIEEIQIFEEKLNESQKFLRGVFPIKNEFAFLGYLDVSILSDINDFGFSNHPDFISTDKLNENAILKLDKLIILDYRNSELKTIYGNLNPTLELNNIILETELTSRNDAWLNYSINGIKYIVYIKKLKYNNSNRVIAVALREKELTISLFDFFKIFFTHSIFLLFIVICYFIFFLRNNSSFQPNLRTQLLLAFLIISLIPLILTAFYFRNLTEQKNKDAIYYKLGKRAFRVENYLIDNYDLYPQDELFLRATRDLNINFSLFKLNSLQYSSDDLVYDVGLIPKTVNSKAYNELARNGTQEILVKEKIDKFELNSFYYKADLFDDQIIIKITDGFNNIRLPLSGSEADVFLFGIYSLAVVFIIIISTLLANQISSPIRKITLATKSVAAGDLSLEIKSKGVGEVKELVAGFQFMIHELKKNQTILAEIEREAAWKEMAKQVAHEIKNPLTPMKLSVQQLVTAYNDNSDKFDNYFSRVTVTLLKQIETLKNIATEFSNFARMPKLQLAQIDLSSILQEAIDLFADETLIINSEINREYLVKGDSEQLKRTFINLIRNVIQAKSSNLLIVVEENKYQYELYFKDNGSGLLSNNFEEIFEPNFSTKEDGMGLGLSMARRYLRSTGADIIVDESSANGTSFKLIFPK